MLLVMNGTEIARRVRRAREDAGMSQEQLAIRAGVTRAWVSKLERGLIEDPGSDRMRRAAAALGADLNYLVTGEQPKEGVSIMVPADRLPLRKRIATLPGVLLEKYWRAVETLVAFEDELLDDMGDPEGKERRAKARGANE